MPLDATDCPEHGRRRTAGQGPTTAAAAVPPANKASAVTQLIPPESLQLLHCSLRNFFAPTLASVTLLSSPPPPPQSRSLTVPAADRRAPAVDNHCCCFCCCCCCNAALFTYKPLANAPSGLGTQDSCLRFKWTPCLVQRVVSVQNIFLTILPTREHMCCCLFLF